MALIVTSIQSSHGNFRQSDKKTFRVNTTIAYREDMFYTLQEIKRAMRNKVADAKTNRMNRIEAYALRASKNLPLFEN